ncbi:hypothetical protein AAEX28_15570 [Lentisphaerota bacterium WC36G]|nr:hypothetical protein LJT99_02330 [Lentisphaerae bacterium WC36]
MKKILITGAISCFFIALIIFYIILNRREQIIINRLIPVEKFTYNQFKSHIMFAVYIKESENSKSPFLKKIVKKAEIIPLSEGYYLKKYFQNKKEYCYQIFKKNNTEGFNFCRIVPGKGCLLFFINRKALTSFTIF